MSAARFRVTYETVTPESAEQGDYADIGYLDAHGFRNSVQDLSGPPAAVLGRDCAMTLREALALFGYDYGRLGVECGDSAFRQADGAIDYQTGEECRLTLHVPFDVTPASLARVRRIVEGTAVHVPD